jgi:hypothetical protein
MLSIHRAFAARIVATILLAVVMQPGCARKKAVTSFISDGVQFHVTAPSTPASGSQGPVQVGTTSASDGLRLRINGRDYGPVKSGDSADVDLRSAEPRVTVNGTARKPVD